MDVKLINPVLEAMLEVLTVMAQLTPAHDKPSLKKGDSAYGDVTGIMSMVGKQAKGSIAITFTEPVILDIARRMLKREFSQIDDSVADLVGEIANMVTGGSKARLEGKGYEFEMSLPTVVRGKHHRVEHKAKGPTVVIPFRVEQGEFFVEVCFSV